MQKFYLILVLIMTFSCTEKQTDKRIAEFENVLGEKQTKALNLLVSDFEENLNKTYPDLTTEKAYRKYLTEIISDSTENWGKFKFQSDKTNFEFHDSGLWNEIYTKDSSKGLRVNTSGKYIRALNSIRHSDSLIEIYLEKRQTAGMMSNELVVPGILNMNPDFNNYFHKRIVILEFSF